MDWNNNGKFDWEDAFINYHIHRSITNANKNNSNPSEDSSDGIFVIGIGLLIFGILMIIGAMMV